MQCSAVSVVQYSEAQGRELLCSAMCLSAGFAVPCNAVQIRLV